MSVAPTGMSVQAAYGHYRNDEFIVNRIYQRKLVWDVQQKEYLIDSIVNGLPIPLILLAKLGDGKFEIVDGLQRLNAIFSFIENQFNLYGKFFDIKEFTRAKIASEKGEFSILHGSSLFLSPEECASILDYQLAVTIYPVQEDKTVTEIFGRFNSGGKKLSPQELRQAGSVDDFANLVRKISSEIRGDSSEDIVLLKNMPTISLDLHKEKINYGIIADDIFWCKHKVVNKKQLRDSEDEEIIIDIIMSIINNSPFPKSKENYNKVYDEDKDAILIKIKNYGISKIHEELKLVLSLLKEVIESDNQSRSFSSIVNPSVSNPVKESFYSVFMAFHGLIINKSMVPDTHRYLDIIIGIESLQKELIKSAHNAKVEDRKKNIQKTTGMIQDYFLYEEPKNLGHKSVLLDIENSIRRSKVETTKYECKQGLVSLSENRQKNVKLIDKIAQTICAIANIGPDSVGYVMIGVADTEDDKNRIVNLDKITPLDYGGRYVVGIDRELSFFNNKIDDYQKYICDGIKNSSLSDPLKTQVLSQIDIININGISIVRITIPSQRAVSCVGDDYFYRMGSETKKATTTEAISISNLFLKH